MTAIEAKSFGSLSSSIRITDDELKKLMHITWVTLSFLNGKGIFWGLASSELWNELEKLKSFARSRGWKEETIQDILNSDI